MQQHERRRGERRQGADAATTTGAEGSGLVRQVGEVLEGVIEDGRGRLSGGLHHRAVVRRRRSVWTAGAAVAGAVAGAGVAYAVRRVVGHDAPDAQEPEQLRAVVDTSPAAPENPVLPGPLLH